MADHEPLPPSRLTPSMRTPPPLRADSVSVAYSSNGHEDEEVPPPPPPPGAVAGAQMQLQAMKLQQQQQQQQSQPRQSDSDSTQRSQSSGSVAGVHSRSGSTVQQRASLPLHPNQPLGQVLAHPRPHPTVSVPSTPSASSASSSALPHSAANYASRTPSGTVAPSPSPGPGPLQLPAHPTTPSVGSAEAELEAAAGINLSKLSPKDLIFGKLLGEGSFAKVVECALRSDPSRKYACKIVDKHFVQKMGKVHTVMNEKKILTLLHGHVGIVKLAYTFQDNTSLYYVMELAEGGEMFSDLRGLGKYDLDTARFYAAQLVEILFYMHSKNIVHRDLKPENLLFSRSLHLKLTDFGTSRLLDASSGDAGRRGSFVGTAEYVSPEVLRDGPAGTSSDLWSLGVTLFQMLSGRVPFRGASEYMTFQKILKARVDWPANFDPAAKDLIANLLVLDPTKRLGATVGDYERLRGHAFFAGVQWGTPSAPHALWEQEVPPRPAPSAVEPEAPEPFQDADADASGEEGEPKEDSNSSGSDDDDDGGGGGGRGRGGSSEDEFAAKMAEIESATTPSAASASASAAASAGAGVGTCTPVAAGKGADPEERDRVAPLPNARAPGPMPSGSASASAASAAGSSPPAAQAASPSPSASPASVHKMSTDGQYSNSVWSRFLRPGEDLLYCGLVMKRRGLFARKRQLLLTSHPRLFYVDPAAMEMKKEVEWSAGLWAEVVDANAFYIHTPNRIYYMRGLSSSAYCWVNEINNLQLALKARQKSATEGSAPR